MRWCTKKDRYKVCPGWAFLKLDVAGGIFKNRFFSGSTPEKKSQNKFFDRKWSKILTCAETCKFDPKISNVSNEGHFRHNRYFDGFSL